jgi:nucleoside-triphosphatase THEP1
MRIVYGSLTYEVLGFYTPDFRTSPNALAYQIVDLLAVGGLA